MTIFPFLAVAADPMQFAPFMRPEVSAFSPLSRGAALVGWWKADAGVFSDAGTTPAVDGEAVRQWNVESYIDAKWNVP